MDDETRRRLESIERDIRDIGETFAQDEARLEAIERIVVQVAVNVSMDADRDPSSYADYLFQSTMRGLRLDSPNPQVHRLREQLDRITRRVAGTS